MPSLLPILFYPDFFTQDFTLLDLKKAAGETPRLLLSLKGEEETVLPRPLCAAVPSYGFAAAGMPWSFPSGFMREPLNTIIPAIRTTII